MKIIATRLNRICASIIPTHQQGFVTKRSITDAALDVLTIMRDQKDTTKQHWLLLVDQQKAFDRVNHDFLQLVLEKMNFNLKFRKLIKNLFNNQEAHIFESGLLSEPFRVERGVRQGDPLSPLLYVLAFEPMLQAIDKNIQGIPSQSLAFKSVAYADDLTIGVGSISDWIEIQNLFNLYEKASNARINKQKTKVIPLTTIARRANLPDMDNYKIVEEQDAFTLLGYEIYPNGQPKKDLWPSTITKLKNSLNNLASRNLSFKGRILIANSLIISRIWYTAYILPPNKKQVSEINSLITQWVKGSSRMLPRYATFQLSYEQGGLQAPIIGNMLEARMLSVLTKLLSENTLWAKIERKRLSETLQSKRNITILQALTMYPIRTKAWPTEWKPYIMAWKKAKGTISSNTTWPWHLEEISLGGKKGDEFCVKNIVNFLRESTHLTSPTHIPANSTPTEWTLCKGIDNKKKDILWRLSHRALPLGYRLRHISPLESGDCPWCENELQTPEHFAVECKVSKTIWKEAYKFLRIQPTPEIPSTIEDILTKSNITQKRYHTTVQWLNIITIYEIWCRYTNTKWGENNNPLTTMVTIINNRIAREIKTLSLNFSTNYINRKICKYLICK